MAGNLLFQRMAEAGDSVGIISDTERATYSQLLERVDGWTAKLDEANIGKGALVALRGDYSLRSVSLLLALIKRGAIAVPIHGGTGAQQEEYLKVAEVGIVAKLDGGEESISGEAVAVTNTLTKEFLTRGHPGLILFSSGSTGSPKASLLDFSALLERYEKPSKKMCTLTFLLLDHIGGINTLFYTLMNGGTVVVTQSRDPDSVCKIIESCNVELLPTSPTFLKMLLLSRAYEKHDLSSLKMISYGTEVMPESTLQALHKALPDVTLKQTYGTTETGILRSRSRDSESLWVKIGGDGYQTKIVDNILWVKAKTAMVGYLNAPSPFDEDGWMNTQDRVEVDGEYVRILGRVSNIINVGGEKVYPAEVESVIMEMPGVVDATVFGHTNPVMGTVVAARLVLTEPEKPAVLLRKVRKFCQGKLAGYQLPMKIEVIEEQNVSDRFKKMRR